jgi:hypothetical protein
MNGQNGSKLSPAQRANMFAQATRQYKQELPSMPFAEGEQRSVSFPKTRFLSRVYLRVEGTYKATHASKTELTLSEFDKYRILRQLRVEINNGFNPYQIGGPELSLYNLMKEYSPQESDNNGIDLLEKVVSSGGTTNKLNYTMELPMTLNDRDPVGLLLLQNEQTIVTMNVDCGYLADMMTDDDITISDIDIKLTPVLETFSVPQIQDAIPDYSIVKLVHQQIERVAGAGKMIVKLPVGLTYRKLFFYIATDVGYTPLDIADLGNIRLVFNQADIPYNISAKQMAYENYKNYGGQLPAGAFAFDFSTQGVANLGGGRDYIDTERLTEFWLEIDFKNVTGADNYVYVCSEKLARLY